MHDQPFVRVIILNYNTSHQVLSLIHQLLNQQYFNFEIIVIDNTSIKEHSSYLHANVPANVHLVLSDKNLGYSGGNNLGLKFNSKKKVDYHLILNPDINISDEFMIKKMVDAFALPENKNVAAQSPLVNTLSSLTSFEQQIQVRRLLHPFQLIIISFYLGKIIFKKWYLSYIYASLMPFFGKYILCDTVNGAAFMIKNSFIQSNGLLDDSVFLYHEELILGKKIKNAGMTCLLNGYVQVGHYQGLSTKSNNMSFSLNMEKYKILSEAYFLEKYCNVSIIAIKLFLFLKHIELILKRIFILYK